MSFLSLIANHMAQKNPYKAAEPYLKQIGPMAQERLNPNIERGNRSYESLEPLYERFANNPAEYLNELQQSYKPSTGYAFREKKALDAARNAAAAGGYLGTPYHQAQAAELAANIGGEDMHQWVQNVLGIQGAGIGGQQGFAEQGYNSNNDLTSILGNALGTQAQNAFGKRDWKNERRGNLINGLEQEGVRTVASLFGGPAGSASSFGGQPMQSSVQKSFGYGQESPWSRLFGRNLG